MKKLSFLLFTLVISVISHAQPSIGIKGGLNLANVRGDVEDNSIRPAYHVGAYATFNFGDKIGSSPKFFITQLVQNLQTPIWEMAASY